MFTYSDAAVQQGFWRYLAFRVQRHHQEFSRKQEVSAGVLARRRARWVVWSTCESSKMEYRLRRLNLLADCTVGETKVLEKPKPAVHPRCDYENRYAIPWALSLQTERSPATYRSCDRPRVADRMIRSKRHISNWFGCARPWTKIDLRYVDSCRPWASPATETKQWSTSVSTSTSWAQQIGFANSSKVFRQRLFQWHADVISALRRKHFDFN